jgi:hypothetical protein
VALEPDQSVIETVEFKKMYSIFVYHADIMSASSIAPKVMIWAT